MARQHLPKRRNDQPVGSVPAGFDIDQVTRDVLAMCRAQGFTLAGVAPVQASERADALRAWLGAGAHGEMAYMEADLAIRLEPAGLLAGARSFVVVVDQYATRNDPPDASVAGVGRIARYARGRNYHDVMKRRLHRVADALRAAHPWAEFRSCVDTAPVQERELAVLAGLGWQGKNTMLIHPAMGSYVLLGVMATTMPLVQSEEHVPDSCGSCTRCIDACPTGAIAPYRVDGSRCISYLTIESRGDWGGGLAPRTGDWLAGCDVCQEVCPHNTPRGGGVQVGVRHDAYRATRSGFDLLEVLGWDEDSRRTALTGSALKRITLAMMRRNAVHAAANWLATRKGDPRDATSSPHAALAQRLRARLAEIAQDPREPGLVRAAAQSRA